MPHNRPAQNPRKPVRDNSKNLSVRMTDEQYQRLQRYQSLTRLTSTTYFRHLIHGTSFRGHSPKLNHALHASVNKIYSNVQQITRHRRAWELDETAARQIRFLADKLCEEVYLLANQK